jgi:hypothetical protein
VRGARPMKKDGAAVLTELGRRRDGLLRGGSGDAGRVAARSGQVQGGRRPVRTSSKAFIPRRLAPPARSPIRRRRRPTGWLTARPHAK